eukprot:GHVR01136538.1.p1 GENE.GHVR01136538.1~~GHVR01136538.1.p1  ORF type:complete len:109 (+),score=8.68 GHVR01136538.1:92-418(+)
MASRWNPHPIRETTEGETHSEQDQERKKSKPSKGTYLTHHSQPQGVSPPPFLAKGYDGGAREKEANQDRQACQKPCKRTYDSCTPGSKLHQLERLWENPWTTPPTQNT